MPTSTPGWAPPLLAVQMLTRLPVPFVARLDGVQVRHAMPATVGWMPLVGAAIGAVTSVVLVLGRLAWPPPVAAGVALAVEALLTGAFHEDAVADFCDAFGGSATGEAARRIMRDSRIGSYGALGLMLLVGLRWTATAALPLALAVPAIVAAAALGRAMPAGLLALAPPREGDGGLGSSVGAPSGGTLRLALILGIGGAVPLAFLRPGATACALVGLAVLLGWLARLVRRRLGGSTGDCLGFAAYLGQLVVLLAALAM